MQRYSPGDVTIITPYVGQLQRLRQHLGRHMTVALNDRDLEALSDEEVCCACPDNPSAACCGVLCCSFAP